MSKPFDVATKQLVNVDPLAWLRFLELPGEAAELVDADLATVVAEADRILRVTNPNYLAHMEMQASYKVDMSERTLFYNVVTHYRYRLPVESVVLLLRKEADGPAITGQVAYGGLTFTYRIVRLWEKTSEELLNAPLALLPLTPLTNVSAEDLPTVVQRMGARIDAEAPVEDRSLLWTTTWLLLGLKYDPAFSRDLLKGVIALKESSTYQWMMEEGRAEGRVQGLKQGLEKGLEQGLEKGLEQGRVDEARRLLLLMGGKRYGDADASTQAVLDAITSQERLEQLATRLFEAESWQELLQ